MDDDICTGQYRVAGLAGYPAYAHVRYGERGERDFDEQDYRSRRIEPSFDELQWRDRGGASLGRTTASASIADLQVV